MGAGEVGVRVHHFRFDPQAELHAQGADVVGQRVQALGPDVRVDVSVSEAGGVAATAADPSVVQNELAAAEGDDDIGWTVSVDSTVCRAHQHAAGARKKGLQAGPNPTTMRSDAPAAA